MKFSPVAIAIVSSFAASVAARVKDPNKQGLGPPSHVPPFRSSSDCDLSGNYVPLPSTANNFCKIKSFNNPEEAPKIKKFCPTNDYDLNLVADDDGLLTGTSSYKSFGDGIEESFSLIGVWDKESCTFSAVSTTTAFTIEGKATGDNRVSVKALKPGVGTNPLALAFQGELEKGINFDSFTGIVDQGFVQLYDGYYGLNWYSMGAIDYRYFVDQEGIDGTGVGYYTGMKSENQVAFTFPATDDEVSPSIWSDTPFSVISGFFTSAHSIGMTLKLRGYVAVGEEDPLKEGKLVGEYAMTLGAPQDGSVLITLPKGFDNINRFEIDSTGGYNDETLGCNVTLSGSDCRQVAIDNLAITGEGIVPKPGELLLGGPVDWRVPPPEVV